MNLKRQWMHKALICLIDIDILHLSHRHSDHFTLFEPAQGLLPAGSIP